MSFQDFWILYIYLSIYVDFQKYTYVSKYVYKYLSQQNTS